MIQSLLVLIFALLFISAAQLTEISVYEHKVLKLADYALGELSKLSDSGIYKTLKLHAIRFAAEETGIFHFNLVLDLELSSPYFKSGEETEVFRMVVMEHKTDKTFSLAINEFPEMDEGAIEKFWIAKVEQKRVQREEAFRRLEIEAIMLKNEEYKLKYEREDMETILDDLDKRYVNTRYPARVANGEDKFNKSDKGELAEIEYHLSKLSLVELYFLTLGGKWKHEESFRHHYAHDFIKYVAQKLLDEEMNGIMASV